MRFARRARCRSSGFRSRFATKPSPALADWFADRFDTCLFNQLCGYTAQTDTRFTGNNAVAAPDTNHIFRPNSRTTDESLTTGDEFNLAIIDKMVARAYQFNNAAGTGNPIRPMRAQGRKLWVLFVHDHQIYQLRSSASAGTWVDYQKSAITGGDLENPLFKGGDLVGEYNGVLLHRAPRVTNGVNSTTGASVANARRAVMCGAQAAMFATGRDFGAGQENKFSWVEESFDYGNQLGVSAGSIFGLKKTRFNSQDYATSWPRPTPRHRKRDLTHGRTSTSASHPADPLHPQAGELERQRDRHWRRVRHASGGRDDRQPERSLQRRPSTPARPTRSTSARRLVEPSCSPTPRLRVPVSPTIANLSFASDTDLFVQYAQTGGAATAGRRTS
jgi:N4-gp56 family major capsid protein